MFELLISNNIQNLFLLAFYLCTNTGPLVARLVVPKQSVESIHRSFIPVSWKRYHRETTYDGRILQIALEAKIDLLSTSMIRGLCSIMKKNLKFIMADVAFIISSNTQATIQQQQHGQLAQKKVESIAACLGLLRFNHIDLQSAPYMPERRRIVKEGYASSNKIDHRLSMDVVRASILLGFNLEDIDTILNKDDDDEEENIDSEPLEVM